MKVKRKIALILALLMFAVNTAIAQLPSGFRQQYKYQASYDASGRRLKNASAAPRVKVLICTGNFGFVFSSAVLTQDWGSLVGSNNIPFDQYGGIQNGWHVYIGDGGPAGVGYLLISQDGQNLRFIPMFERGNYHDYVSY